MAPVFNAVSDLKQYNTRRDNILFVSLSDHFLLVIVTQTLERTNAQNPLLVELWLYLYIFTDTMIYCK